MYYVIENSQEKRHYILKVVSFNFQSNEDVAEVYEYLPPKEGKRSRRNGFMYTMHCKELCMSHGIFCTRDVHVGQDNQTARVSSMDEVSRFVSFSFIMLQF